MALDAGYEASDGIERLIDNLECGFNTLGGVLVIGPLREDQSLHVQQAQIRLDPNQLVRYDAEREDDRHFQICGRYLFHDCSGWVDQ